MSGIFLDGCQMYNASYKGPWVGTKIRTKVGYQSRIGFTGFDSNNMTDLVRSFPNNGNVIYFGMRAIKAGTAGYGTTIYFMDSGSVQFSLVFDYNAGVRVYLVNSLGSTISTVQLGNDALYQYLYIELKAQASNSASWEIKVDGDLKDSGSGADFQLSANAYINQIRAYVLYGDEVIIQDMYLVDDQGSTHNTYLGALAFTKLPPTSDVSNSYNLSTGSDAHALVDDAPCTGDSDYIYNNVASAAEFAFDSLSGSPTIYGVNIYSTARRETVGDPTSLKYVSCVDDSNGTEREGTERTPSESTTYDEYLDTWWIDDYTSALWTYSAINSLNATAKLRA